MQHHERFEPTKFVASFLSRHYKGHSVQVLRGCCRKCLKHGQPTIYSLATHPWSRLLEEETIDPYQTASVFYPGSKFHSAYFKKPVLNIKEPELPCKYPGTCELTCLLCNKFIDGPGVELKDWPGFKVHAQCTAKCQFFGCTERLPDFPAYISYQRSNFMCDQHGKSLHDCMQGLTLTAITPTLVSARKEVKENHVAKPTPLPKPAAPIEKKPEQVKKTVHFKADSNFKSNYKKTRARADKFDGDKSKAITDFFLSPKAAKPTPPSREEAPRRFIRNKKGEIYAHWKGDCAHCIKTDAVLFRSTNFSGRRVGSEPKCKLDFTPPQSLIP